MPQTMDDHDLLVRLDTKLDALSGAVADMKTALPTKADASRVEKLEQQVEAHGKKLYLMAGGVAAIEFLLRCVLR